MYSKCLVSETPSCEKTGYEPSLRYPNTSPQKTQHIMSNDRINSVGCIKSASELDEDCDGWCITCYVIAGIHTPSEGVLFRALHLFKTD